MKRCAGCKAELPLSDFGTDRSKKDGHAYRCFECQKGRYKRYYAANRSTRIADAKRWKERNPEHNAAYRREYHLRTLYGITVGEFDALLLSQGGKCAICCKTPPEDQKRRWHVDHNHETGQVRSILCNKCNVLIGMADEDMNILQSAISYLSDIDSKAGDL